jgi:hypothetical protein
MTILKQLIENMIGDYLEESHDGYDLAEEVFDEISEETWEAIHEAILNELSPELLQRYKSVAKRDLARKEGGIEWERDQGRRGDQKAIDRMRWKRDNRKYGLKKVDGAIDKATAQKNKDAKELSGADFKQKYRMTKAAWKASNKK